MAEPPRHRTAPARGPVFYRTNDVDAADTVMPTDPPTDNDGQYVDNIGAKGGGKYPCEVC